MGMNSLKRLAFAILFASLLLGCGTGHRILGSTMGYTGPDDDVQVLADMQIDNLHIRHVRYFDKERCDRGGSMETIELNGEINDDAAFVIGRILRNQRSSSWCYWSGYHAVTRGIVFMNSRGGSLTAGFEIGKLIREYEWNTWILNGQRCESACALAFIAGAFRQMSGDAVLIFHAPYRLVGSGSFARPDCSNSRVKQDVRDYFRSVLGYNHAERLYERTMQYCSRDDGWEINGAGAKLYGLTDIDDQDY